MNTPDGMTLSVNRVSPPKKAVGIVHILHGMGEHASRYEEFAVFLSKNGFVVYTHDHRKHGLSLRDEDELGVFGKNETFDKLSEDVAVVQRYIRKTDGKLKMSMLGHSMGSVVLRRYLQMYSDDVDKAIIMGTLPNYRRTDTVAPRMLAKLSGVFKKETDRNHFMANLLNKSINKHINASKTKYDWLSNSETVVENYIADPRCGFAYNTWFYKHFFKGLQDVNMPLNIARTMNVAHLYISGEDDPLAGKNGKPIEELLRIHEQEIEHFKGEMKLISDARHEVLNEKNRLETFNYLLDWIERD